MSWKVQAKTPKKRSKYNAKGSYYKEMYFPSKKELKRYQDLEYLERSGEIKDLKRQVRYKIIEAAGPHKEKFYVADHVYVNCKTGKEVVEDVKGVITDVYRLKRQLMLIVHGIKIKEM